jgi:hypothetical protein
VIARLQAIDASLPTADGIAWFTKLYLRTTEAVAAELGRGGFADPVFLERLDLAFANLYFAALRMHLADPARAPRAWAPLFAARRRKDIAPVQFAFAGANANINADLPVAVVATCRKLGIDLLRARREHADFLAINPLLEQTETRVNRWFATGFIGIVDAALGQADDRVAMWEIRRARHAAWANAQTLWVLQGHPALYRRSLETLDRTIGFGCARAARPGRTVLLRHVGVRPRHGPIRHVGVRPRHGRFGHVYCSAPRRRYPATRNTLSGTTASLLRRMMSASVWR